MVENVVKKEELAGMFEKFTQQLVSTLAAKNSNEWSRVSGHLLQVVT